MFNIKLSSLNYFQEIFARSDTISFPIVKKLKFLFLNPIKVRKFLEIESFFQKSPDFEIPTHLHFLSIVSDLNISDFSYDLDRGLLAVSIEVIR